ncbi:hypothetical protein [Ferrimicrobium acidiphilum]|uniref:hypothetical protein n=1 Tax=Ferrimicrobium acidiphilum TaxID=121039 RepID=UPI0023F17694|nr:hypothetical protein [Ferrimicrobium acidiphilum]
MRTHSIKTVLLVAAFAIELMSFLLSLAVSPLSLDTLDIALICLAIYWYLSSTVSAVERPTSLLSIVLVGILALEGYVLFLAAPLLAIGAIAVIGVTVADYHNFKHDAYYGLVACKDVFRGRVDPEKGK